MMLIFELTTKLSVATKLQSWGGAGDGPQSLLLIKKNLHLGVQYVFFT